MAKELTKNQRIAQVFRDAKMVLNSGRKLGQTSFICCAIGMTYTDFYMAENAKQIIRERIAPYDTLESWLEMVAKIPRKQLTVRNIQKYRHAWLDSLIKEFENKG